MSVNSLAKELSSASVSSNNNQLNSDDKTINPWLHAWQDSLANIKTTTSCLRLGDINSDADFKLCLCDIVDKKLRIYKGTSQIIDYELLDTPIAMCLIYMENSLPKIPSVAVAAASNVFIYRQLRPYKKWSCKLNSNCIAAVYTNNITFHLFLYIFNFNYVC